MPPPDQLYRRQKAVYWEATGPNQFGEQQYLSPVELRVGWIERVSVSENPTGGTNPADVTVVPGRALVLDSLLWKGSLDRWDPSVPQPLFRVVGYSESTDIKGRFLSRQATLRRYGGSKPSLTPTTPPGPTPPPVSTVDLNYTHRQDVPSAVWVVVHNLGKYPSVSVVDSGGTWVVGDVAYSSQNQVVLSFGAPFAGLAYLN